MKLILKWQYPDNVVIKSLFFSSKNSKIRHFELNSKVNKYDFLILTMFLAFLRSPSKTLFFILNHLFWINLYYPNLKNKFEVIFHD